jgi:hypothetical protein
MTDQEAAARRLAAETGVTYPLAADPRARPRPSSVSLAYQPPCSSAPMAGSAAVGRER